MEINEENFEKLLQSVSREQKHELKKRMDGFMHSMKEYVLGKSDGTKPRRPFWLKKELCELSRIAAAHELRLLDFDAEQASEERIMALSIDYGIKECEERLQVIQNPNFQIADVREAQKAARELGISKKEMTMHTLSYIRRIMELLKAERKLLAQKILQ